MAKHRPHAKPKGRPSSSPTTTAGSRHSASAEPERVVSPPPPPLNTPPRRSTYVEAVAVYERALEALQRHEYETAGDMLESVLRTYPEEKELHERVKLYLN